MNNSNKAAVIYNSKGNGGHITLENIGGEKISSKNSEKLLGLHLNSGFNWKTHVDQISIDLKKEFAYIEE